MRRPSHPQNPARLLGALVLFGVIVVLLLLYGYLAASGSASGTLDAVDEGRATSRGFKPQRVHDRSPKIHKEPDEFPKIEPQGVPEARVESGANVSTAAMKVHGIVRMDPGLLKGREGFVMGCGETVPLGHDLKYSIESDVLGCQISAMVIDSEGLVAVGTGHIVGANYPSDSEDIVSIQKDLEGPSGEEFLPWSELMARSQRSLDVMLEVCKSGAFGGDEDVCFKEAVAPMLEGQAWLEELAPLMEALGEPAQEHDP